MLKQLFVALLSAFTYQAVYAEDIPNSAPSQEQISSDTVPLDRFPLPDGTSLPMDEVFKRLKKQAVISSAFNDFFGGMPVSFAIENLGFPIGHVSFKRESYISWESGTLIVSNQPCRITMKVVGDDVEAIILLVVHSGTEYGCELIKTGRILPMSELKANDPLFKERHENLKRANKSYAESYKSVSK